MDRGGSSNSEKRSQSELRERERTKYIYIYIHMNRFGVKSCAFNRKCHTVLNAAFHCLLPPH